MIRVSVIVPFHNSERYIGNCIEGLLSQSYPAGQYEIIMVDNNSTDASAEIVRQYPRISLLSEAKQGSYAARNRGLREVKDDIIAFTDADCVPFNHWLQEIVTAMGQRGVGIVLGNRQPARDSFLLSMLAAYDHGEHNYVFNSGIKELYYGHTNNMAVRKKLFDELGPFVERARGSDTIFVRQAVDRYGCGAVRYCSRVQVQHLEIDSLSKLYRKYFIYGLSSRGYGRIVRVRRLNRALVFHKIVQGQGYSWMESTLLLGSLIIGNVYWVLGYVSAAWHLEEGSWRTPLTWFRSLSKR